MIKKTLTFTLLILLLLGVVATVQAATVSPWRLSGSSNHGKTCAYLNHKYADPGTTWTEFKLEDGTLTSGDHDDGTLEVNITLAGSPGGSFDWTSNIGVDAIVVKDGRDGANFYVYDGRTAPTGTWRDIEETGDTGLKTPNNGRKNISHISFCYDAEAPQTGNIIIEKQVDDPPGWSIQSFEFNTDYGSNFSLNHGQTNDSGLLTAGTYSVSEIVPAGWNQTSAACDDGSDPSAIGLDAGETVTCVFHNEMIFGTIIVEKQTDPDGSTQSFEFSRNWGVNFFLSDDETNVSTGIVPFDGYSVSEIDVPAGWTLTSATCDDGSPPDHIDLNPGETVTCIFTNTQEQPGTIIVEKQTDPDGAPDSFSFGDDASGSIKDGEQIVVNDLVPGAYTSQETVPAGWELTSIVCDDDNSTVSLADRRANFQVEAGETVKCTFYNRLPLDYGDALDSYGTLLASNGARHAIVAGHSLGPIVDPEPDGQPSPLADGDDLNPPGAPDDEDGVTLAPFLTAGTPGTVIVDGGPSGGMLDAWIDFNGNGIFDDPAEHLFGGISILLGPGPNPPLAFPVPLTAVPGSTYARFRLSNTGGLAPTGFAPVGEVEDYLVEIEAPPQLGTITAHKFNDLNGDGSDSGEPGLNDWEMTLHKEYGCSDRDGYILDSGLTDSNGDKSFTDLPPGKYSVRETSKPDWVPTTPICQDVDLAANELEIVNFGNWQPPSGDITVHKFNDLNGDGLLDADEPGLSDWEMTLYWGPDCPEDVDKWPISTDSSGNASFLGLAQGDYSVKETPQAGWQQTTPICQNVTLAAGGSEIVYVGNYELGYIAAIKYRDVNGNGTPEYNAPDNEPRLNGWLMTIDDGQGNITTGTTGADGTGRVEFHDLPIGTYTVCETLQAGWINTEPGSDVCRTVQVRDGKKTVARFGNAEYGAIIVEKQTDPDDAPDSFTFGGDANGSIKDNEQIVVGNLTPGTYDSTETVPADWNLTAIVCDDSDSTGDINTATATFHIESGETVKCTFTNTEEPTAITLASFNIEANDGRAMVMWETGTEIDNAGFNIYRAASEAGPWVKINKLLIAAEGDPVAGASYSFVDKPGRGAFYYRLEDIDLSGVTTLHTAVMAQLGPTVRTPWFKPTLPDF
ncbi:MAG: hypothetical protein GY832_37345 [Chloroflexi bacterium]|nr:hypothetical protein [Chloroflexota bacterium]